MYYTTTQHSTVNSTVQYNTVQYSRIQYSTVQYSTVQYDKVQYSTVQYSTVQYSTVQYDTVQYSTVHMFVNCIHLTVSNDELHLVQYSLVVVYQEYYQLLKQMLVSTVASTLQECVDHIYICLHTTISHIRLLLVMVYLAHLYIIIETTNNDVKRTN